MVCLSLGGSFHFRHMWLRQVTPVFQERQQAEGNRRWRRREEKRLSEQIRIRGGRLLKSCAPSPSSTSWPALYLFAKRSSRQRQDIFGALNYIHHCENIPTKIKVLCFDRPMILALTKPRYLEHLLALTPVVGLNTFSDFAHPCLLKGTVETIYIHFWS